MRRKHGRGLVPLPDYIVLRAADNAPAGILPPDMDGRWIDLGKLAKVAVPKEAYPMGGGCVAEPSGRFEIREDDGAVGEVWEVRPA